MRQRQQPLDDTDKQTGDAMCRIAGPAPSPPLDVRECRVMVAIRIYDSAARNLMRPPHPAATALTAVGGITDSAPSGQRARLHK
ncbi:hypothetical protein C1H21_13525 [Xanthomonas arboricola pv. juglandis]|nr:hypothetical protein C1H21_13525 [Xanthomonas arboricola pv. juglandis]